MVLTDTHVHSKYSIDSEEEIDAICSSAIDKGIKAICITDHIDFNPQDMGFGYYDRTAYFNAIADAKDKYNGKLLVLSGIEFSEPHLYSDELMDFSKFSYDMILGSIHWLDYNFVGQRELLDNYPQSEIEEIYYEMILKAIDSGGFDVLAHVDFPKRYYKSSSVSEAKMLEVSKLLVENDIALEINTSSLRKGLDESMPSIDMVEKYIGMGGSKLTIGSDAHSCSELANDIMDVISGLSERAKLSLGVVINRKFVYLKDLFGT